MADATSTPKHIDILPETLKAPMKAASDRVVTYGSTAKKLDFGKSTEPSAPVLSYASEPVHFQTIRLPKEGSFMMKLFIKGGREHYVERKHLSVLMEKVYNALHCDHDIERAVIYNAYLHVFVDIVFVKDD